MMTRMCARQHSPPRSGRTSVPPLRGSSAMRSPGAHLLASSTIALPAWPARTFSTCPGHAPPPMILACSMIACASRSLSSMRPRPIAHDAGTRSTRATWMPRRRRAASLTAVATASCGSKCPTSKATSHESYARTRTSVHLPDWDRAHLLGARCRSCTFLALELRISRAMSTHPHASYEFHASAGHGRMMQE